jgi:hypothetical protein
VIADVDAVVHDGGADYGLPCALGRADVGGVPLDPLDRRTLALPVDEANDVAPAHEFAGERGAGGAGAEDGVQGASGVGVGSHGDSLPQRSD